MIVVWNGESCTSISCGVAGVVVVWFVVEVVVDVVAPDVVSCVVVGWLAVVDAVEAAVVSCVVIGWLVVVDVVDAFPSWWLFDLLLDIVFTSYNIIIPFGIKGRSQSNEIDIDDSGLHVKFSIGPGARKIKSNNYL